MANFMRNCSDTCPPVPASLEPQGDQNHEEPAKLGEKWIGCKWLNKVVKQLADSPKNHGRMKLIPEAFC
ncbi:hypothetical protein ACJ72_00051 [Emergomyces africanus]|uniref:Uncharacterized protein n=1 Tax=Emergomyces africanus TaxID=1955775 RepID=A0A1B7P9L7_9EURO|nr:hypothetical protein ACJ72_00051 [Emergomyces africanus]